MADDKQRQLSAHEQRMQRHQQSKQHAHEAMQHKSSGSKKSYTKYYVLGAIVALIAVYFLFFSGGSKTPPMPVIGAHPFTGLPTSDVNIVIFGDFQCPFTKQFHDEVFAKLFEAYKDVARIEFHPMPTGKHNYDRISAEAAYCANEQGKFWEYGDLLFATQGQGEETALKGYAAQLGLDEEKFNACFDSHKYKETVQQDYLEGRNLDVAVTPTIFINHLKLQGSLPFYQYQRYVEFVLKQ